MKHIRENIFRGFLAVTPLLLCVAAIFLVYKLIDKRIMGFLDQFMDVRQIPGLGLALLLIFLYVLGWIVTQVIGRRMFNMVEALAIRIPIIKHIYTVSKQLLEVLGSQDDVLKRAVLVNYPTGNKWSVAFVTGCIRVKGQPEELLKVFVPMCHPVIGFVYVVRKDKVIDPGWSLEQGFKMMLTFGIVMPGGSLVSKPV